MFMSKDLIKFIVKVLLYALTLIASYLGVASLSSCTVSRSVTGYGRAKVVVTDTTTFDHRGFLNFKFR